MRGAVGPLALGAAMLLAGSCTKTEEPIAPPGPANGARHAISGTITPAVSGAAATVALSGDSTAATTTDVAGGYRFDALPRGAYTIAPSKSGFVFTPGSRQASVGDADVPGVDFTAAPATGVVFLDDFGGATLDTSWVAMDRHGDYSNVEQQCYLPANVSVSGGNLSIVSRAESRTCGDATHAPSAWSTTSGMIQWRTFHFTYGTVEFRAKMAGGQGTWPAVWLLGANCQASNVGTADNVGTCDWPQPGSDEIDITEILHSDHTHVNQGIASGSNGFHTCTATTADVSQNFHVYQLVWTPGQLVWKIDGAPTCTITSDVPSTPMFLMINTAMGGVGGTVNPSTLPQTLTVDYVKVTQP